MKQEAMLVFLYAAKKTRSNNQGCSSLAWNRLVSGASSPQYCGDYPIQCQPSSSVVSSPKNNKQIKNKKTPVKITRVAVASPRIELGSGASSPQYCGDYTIHWHTSSSVVSSL